MKRQTFLQMRRFLVVGLITVGIDALSYRLLLMSALPVDAAKAIGFTAGALFAYFANRSYTFASGERGVRTFVAFAGVYLSTLVVNVSVNAGTLKQFGRSETALVFAFLCATGTSATLNFVGMKLLVFRTPSAMTAP